MTHKETKEEVEANNWPFLGTFDENLLPPEFKTFMVNKGFTAPTTVQAQAWPLALMGQDMVVLSQTGRYLNFKNQQTDLSTPGQRVM